MASKRMCVCYCHQEARGNYIAAKQLMQWELAIQFSRSAVLNCVLPVDADDPIEAAVAQGCDCLQYHCPALSDLYGTPWTPETDQADGTGEED